LLQHIANDAKDANNANDAKEFENCKVKSLLQHIPNNANDVLIYINCFPKIYNLTTYFSILKGQ
jgi:hypothetical protein